MFQVTVKLKQKLRPESSNNGELWVTGRRARQPGAKVALEERVRSYKMSKS